MPSAGRNLAKLLGANKKVTLRGGDSDFNVDFDSDVAKLASLEATVKAQLDSDSGVIQSLRSEVQTIKSRLDSDDSKIQSLGTQISAGLLNLADSDLIINQLTAKISSVITNLDSDSVAIQNVQGQIDTIKSRLDSDESNPVNSKTLDMGSNDIVTTGKVYFANMFSTEGDLPSATTYHGMFAHVHATGAGYFAHGGNWIKLANNTDIDTLKSRLDSDDTFVQSLQTQIDIIKGRLDSDDAAIQTAASSGGGGGGASVSISDSAPSSPSAGDLWFDSSEGIMYIYYNDGDSAQWVGVSGYSTNQGFDSDQVVSIVNENTSSGSSVSGVTWHSTTIDSDFTAVVNKGYFVDTNKGKVKLTLPASATVGDMISIVDLKRNFDNERLQLNSINTTKYQGKNDSDITYDTKGQVLTIVYSTDSEGWIPLEDNGTTLKAVGYVQNPSIEFLVVAGGGAGGTQVGGGGGAGGYRTSTLSIARGTELTITVGSGGNGNVTWGQSGGDGSDSSVSGTGITAITSAGGGGGGGHSSGYRDGRDGGSGGGQGSKYAGSGASSGNVPSVSPSQGNDGGLTNTSSTYNAGGGGGHGAAGNNGGSPSSGGEGGIGTANSITGTSIYYAGGGSGTIQSNRSVTGYNPAPQGGGGNGDAYQGTNGSAGTANTGGGGGNAYGGPGRDGQAGGSGVVIVNEPGAGPFVASGVWKLKEVFSYKKENLWK